MKLSFTLALLAVLFCGQQAYAGGFSNGGKLEMKNINITVDGTLDNSGSLIGKDSASLTADTLSGKGLIQSPQIMINVNTFAFTGTIDCSDKCTILASKSFNQKMFKRSGKGEFTILIDQSTAKSLTNEDYHITDELPSN